MDPQLVTNIFLLFVLFATLYVGPYPVFELILRAVFTCMTFEIVEQLSCNPQFMDWLLQVYT